jgi:uncharacterized protein (TIGR03086 family)
MPNQTTTPTSTPVRTLSIEHTDGAPLAPDDPRVPLARAVVTAGVVLAELTTDTASNPTPCAGWDAHQMGGHLVAILERVAALPVGRSIDEMALVRDDLTVQEMPAAFTSAAHAVQAAWTDEALASMVTVPWGEIPGVVAMHVYAAELLIHTWDLATAIGVEPQWHQPDVEAAVQAVQMGIPHEGRDLVDMPFGPVVTTADDAPAIHRLVAWVGRTPTA